MSLLITILVAVVIVTIIVMVLQMTNWGAAEKFKPIAILIVVLIAILVICGDLGYLPFYRR